MAVIEMLPSYATDSKMPGEHLFFSAKMPGSTHTKLVLPDSPAVVLWRFWRRWVSGLHVWRVTI